LVGINHWVKAEIRLVKQVPPFKGDTKTVRQAITQPLAYTQNEALAELAKELPKLSFGQEIDIRRARDRPEPTPSVLSHEPAYVTIAKCALIKVPRVARSGLSEG